MAKPLRPDKLRKIEEALLEVRYALPSMPPKERKILIEGRESIIQCRWRAESKMCWH